MCLETSTALFKHTLPARGKFLKEQQWFFQFAPLFSTNLTCTSIKASLTMSQIIVYLCLGSVSFLFFVMLIFPSCVPLPSTYRVSDWFRWLFSFVVFWPLASSMCSSTCPPKALLPNNILCAVSRWVKSCPICSYLWKHAFADLILVLFMAVLCSVNQQRVFVH